MSNKNPTEKDAGKNLSNCINPKTKEKTMEEKYKETQDEINKRIFGE